MKLVTIARTPAGSPGALIDNEVLDFKLALPLLEGRAESPDTVAEILAMDRTYCADLQLLVNTITSDQSLRSVLRKAGALTSASATSLMAPNPRPHLIVCHGKGYHSHIRDFDKDARAERPPHPPAGFVKASSAITGPDSAIRIPKSCPSMVDFEGELCIVFGRAAHCVPRDEAWNYVAGFTIINDVSARDWIASVEQASAHEAGVYSALNLMYKSFPTFCPMGPAIVTLDELGQDRDLHLTTRLNGEIMQDAWTSELIWPITELIEYYSNIYSFAPGDLLSTGTPGGVGVGRDPPIFMRQGDVVSVTIDGIGTLTNSVVSE